MNHRRTDGDLTRRCWIGRTVALATAAGGASGSLSAAPSVSAGEDERIAKLETQAKQAGIAPFGVTRTDHYLGVGNAPESFRKGALEVCEGLGRVFLKHLRDRGYQVDYPSERMMVVVLKDAISYGALVGKTPGKEVGGHFDLDGDRLVVFDFRPEQGPGGGGERINTFTLVHETTHLLCFNTGLLRLDREPAKAITEGLATYFEMWRRTGNVVVGRVNQPRIEAIRRASQDGGEWIDTVKLLTDDSLFDDPETAQQAYGQAWILTYHLLSSRSLWPNVAAYFEELRKDVPGDRVKALERHLGPIAKLDDVLRRLGRELVRR